jgi:alpha-glucosidase
MSKRAWWQSAVFYQIYPRSFADGNGDGIGDFAGMTEQLEYLAWLGIDAIWLSPHYPSPQADGGYDISDFCGVAPEYGTLDDLRGFIRHAHRLGMRVITDLVLNHSSDQHPWFAASRSSRNHPQRNWYIWRDGRDGGPPNNWQSLFGGPAWTHDAATDQWYYHQFLPEQPDLNWRNPALRAAYRQVVRFWLDMGVDGFRLDAVGAIFEREDLADHGSPLTMHELQRRRLNPAGPPAEDLAHEWARLFEHQSEQPGLHELLRELRSVVDEVPATLLVGESSDVRYHGNGDDELQLVFNFPLMAAEQLTAGHVRANQQQRLAELAAVGLQVWPCNTLANHDSPRIYERYGDGVHNDAQIRLHFALLLTLRGTPFLYYGDEIGMRSLLLDDPALFRDTWGLRTYHALRDEFGLADDAALQRAAATSRDSCRAPMAWAAAANGGFCPPDVSPWLPAHPAWTAGVNVADQRADETSLLHFVRRLLHLRRHHPALQTGLYTALPAAGPNDLAFIREDAVSGERLLVALNFGAEPLELSCADVPADAPILFSAPGIGNSLCRSSIGLGPFGILIVALDPAPSSAQHAAGGKTAPDAEDAEDE